MKTNKILFFDIDGTILSETTHTIPASTIKALQKAKENKHLIFINTGRTFAEIDQIIKDLDPDGYVCGCGTYINYHHQVLLSKTLAPARCKEIKELLRQTKIDGVLEGSQAIYFDHQIKHPDLNAIKNIYQKQNFNLLDFDDPNLSFDKFTVWFDQSADLKTFKQAISHDFDYIDRASDFGEIVPKGYSKATGIKFLLDYFQLKLEDAYVFGDSFNDLSMLKYVKYSIVMGNGNHALFDLAYFVTKKLEDDGIEYAMQQLQLIR